jgi:hypothetical protein
MNTKQFWLDVAITIPITFFVAAAVTCVYSLLAHGSGAVDWGTAFVLAIVFGSFLPVTRSLPGKNGS